MMVIAALCVIWLLAALWSRRLAPASGLWLRLGLIALGIPLLGYVTYASGPSWGLAGLIAGTLVLGLHQIQPLRRASGESD